MYVSPTNYDKITKLRQVRIIFQKQPTLTEDYLARPDKYNQQLFLSSIILVLTEDYLATNL